MRELLVASMLAALAPLSGCVTYGLWGARWPDGKRSHGGAVDERYEPIEKVGETVHEQTVAVCKAPAGTDGVELIGARGEPSWLLRRSPRAAAVAALLDEPAAIADATVTVQREVHGDRVLRSEATLALTVGTGAARRRHESTWVVEPMPPVPPPPGAVTARLVCTELTFRDRPWTSSGSVWVGVLLTPPAAVIDLTLLLPVNLVLLWLHFDEDLESLDGGDPAP